MATKPTLPGLAAAAVRPIRAAGPVHQTVLFTALPNGISDGKAKLSVFISPRLESTGATESTRLPLSSYPDWLNWPDQAAALTFDVLLDGHQATGVTKVAPAAAASDPTPAEIWSAIFSGTTPVKPYEYKPPNLRQIRYFPVQNIHNRLREIYQAVAWESPAKAPALLGAQATKPLTSFFVDIALTRAQRVEATREISAQFSRSALRTMRVPGYAPPAVAPKIMPGVQTHAPAPAVIRGKARIPSLKIGALAGTPAPVSAAALDFHMTRMFFERPELSAMLARPKPWNETADFHQIVSALGQFPDLMRRVGLVIDLEIPVAGLAHASAVWVVPHWTPKTPTGSGGKPDAPRTACNFDPGTSRFFALNKPPDADNPTGSDIANGMLKLNDPDRFEIGQMDVDGTALKTLSLAETFVAAMPAASAVHAPAAAVKPGGAAIRLPAGARPAVTAHVAPTPAKMESTTLNAMRSAGIWVAENNRAARLAAHADDATARNNAVKAGKTNQQTLYAEDIARGYRVDVWDEATKKWYALCRRVGTYNLTKSSKSLGPVEDEGWITTGLTHGEAPDAPSYLHEVMFRFEGWGLCVPRPGTAMPPPGVPEDNSFPYGIDIVFAAAPASFPRLRFGHEYRLRARVVDLAGNSLPRTLTDDSMATPMVTYFRHEPINPPALIPRKDLKTTATPGESVEHMVIHSLNATPAQDSVVTGDTTERNAAAPKVSEMMAETHGKFDTATGLDPNAYSIIISHDGDFPTEGYVDRPSLTMPYLPDPFAANCALRFHYTHNTGSANEQIGNMPFAPGAPTNKWPDIQSFRLIAYEPPQGAAPPAIEVDRTNRIVRIPLPKAATAELVLSCGLTEADLPKTGIWRYTVEKPFNPALAASKLSLVQNLKIHREMHKPATLAANAATLHIAQPDIQRLGTLRVQATQGRNWLISPTRTVLLVHAVQQPLITPDISKLAAVRRFGQTWASLVDEFPISGKSTLKVAVAGRWDEYYDNLTEPGPRVQQDARGTAFEYELAPEDEKVTWQGAAPRAAVLAVAEDTRTRHEFGDTKRRQVNYTCTATTRFREFFARAIANDPNFKITRESAEAMVDVPSSARPAAPNLLYVVPTFSWNRDAAKLTSYRAGGLRVYMHRPWFSSGVGERLGVVLADQGRTPPSLGPNGSNDKLFPYLTQWGHDPIWKPTSRLADYPRLANFLNTAEDGKASGLELDEVRGSSVSVAGYEVFYDEKRQLWYADIDMNVGSAYMPFVRLVLARFQPNSVKDATHDAHLSRCVIAEFAQIIPGRYASVTRSADGKTLNVSVSGPTYAGSYVAPNSSSQVQVSIERKLPNVDEPLCWVPAAEEPVYLSRSLGGTRLAAALTLPREPTLPKTPAARKPAVRAPVRVPTLRLGKTWSGQVKLPQGPGPFRLVIKEYEIYRVDERWTKPAGRPALTMVPAPMEGRLVYAETMMIS